MDYKKYNKYKNYAEDEERWGGILSSALVGTVMVCIVCGRLFESNSYEFFTVVLSAIVVACL